MDFNDLFTIISATYYMLEFSKKDKTFDILDCTMHMQIFNILQGLELQMACLKLKFGETEYLLDVLMQYEILGI